MWALSSLRPPHPIPTPRLDGELEPAVKLVSFQAIRRVLPVAVHAIAPRGERAAFESQNERPRAMSVVGGAHVTAAGAARRLELTNSDGARARTRIAHGARRTRRARVADERPMSVASGVCFGGGASCGDAPHSDGGAPRADDGGAPRDDGGAPRDDGGAPRDDGAPPGVKTPCCRRSQRLSII